MHFCLPHTHTLHSASSTSCVSSGVSGARGSPSVGPVGAFGWVRGRASARLAWCCCPGCGLYGDGALCMACDVSTHGEANSCTIKSTVNSRVVRSAEAGGRTKPSKVGSWIEVGVPIVDNEPGDARLADYLRWAPKKWPFEARECRVVNSPFVEMRKFVLAGGCEVVSTIMQTHEWSSVSTGPGEQLRSWLGWTPLLHIPSSGVWLFRGGATGRAASCCACVHSGLGFSGTYRTALGGRAALSLLICVWAKSSRWATNWGSLLGATPGFVEGHRTSIGTLVCLRGNADVCKPELLRWVRVVCSLA